MTYRLIGFSGHGGGCCGARHISRMSLGDDRWGRLKEITHVVERFQEPGRGKVLEIIMTDQQIRTSPNLTSGLKKLGFKLVSRFRNANSGNYCNVLHRYPLSGKGSGLKNSPYLNKRGK